MTRLSAASARSTHCSASCPRMSASLAGWPRQTRRRTSSRPPSETSSASRPKISIRKMKWRKFSDRKWFRWQKNRQFDKRKLSYGKPNYQRLILWIQFFVLAFKTLNKLFCLEYEMLNFQQDFQMIFVYNYVRRLNGFFWFLIWASNWVIVKICFLISFKSFYSENITIVLWWNGFIVLNLLQGIKIHIVILVKMVLNLNLVSNC